MVWKKNEAHNLGRWVQPTLSMSFWQPWAGWQSYRKIGWKPTSGEMVLLDGYTIIQKEAYDLILNAMQRAIDVLDTKPVDHLCAVAEENVQNSFRVGEQLKRRELSLHQGLKVLFDSWHELCCTWLIVLVAAIPVDEAMYAEAEKSSVSVQKLSEVIAPDQDTPLLQQAKEAQDFAKKIQAIGLDLTEIDAGHLLSVVQAKDVLLAKLMETHLGKFAWVGTHHCWGPQFDAAALLEQMKTHSHPQTADVSIQLPARLQFLVNQNQKLGYWRQCSAEASDMAAFWGRSYLTDVAKRFGLTYDEGVWLSDWEILDGLQGKPVPGREEIKKREKAFGIVMEQGVLKVIHGSELQKWLDALIEKADFTQTTLKGIPASAGVAIGDARVVLTPRQAERIQEGQILVVPQTTPDFVPFMRKAAAVVTDEGGLTCHAAIVSRELGKPCVVGTLHATALIQSGERIEVNGVAGTVKRLAC